MASNQTTLPNVSENEETLLTGVNENVYEDQSIGAELTKKDINRVAWRSMLLQASFNYERMQASGWLYGLLPALKKIHTNKRDLARAMKGHMGFFNTHPFLVTFVIGIILAMERSKPVSYTHLDVYKRQVTPCAQSHAEAGSTNQWLYYRKRRRYIRCHWQPKSRNPYRRWKDTPLRAIAMPMAAWAPKTCSASPPASTVWQLSLIHI